MSSNNVNRLDYFRAFWSLLSALPYSDHDVHYSNIIGERAKHISDDTINYYLKPIYREGNDIEVPWIETSHGVYVIAERNIPVSRNRKYRSSPSIAVLYADTPEMMIDVLSGNVKNSHHIDVLSLHQQNAHFVNGEVSYINILKKIRQDSSKLRDDIQSHETFIDEGDHLYRSDSSIIFADESPEQPDHYYIYQYFNPMGKDGFYINADMMKNKRFKSMLKAIAVNTTPRPISSSHLNTYLQNLRNSTAKNTMNQISPNAQFKGMNNTVKKILSNSTQPLFFLIARLHVPSLVTGAVMAGAFSYGFLIALGFFSVLKVAGISSIFTKGALTAMLLSNNPLSKTLNGVSRFMSKTLNRTRIINKGRLYDYKFDLSVHGKFTDDNIRSCIVKPNFFNGIKIVPYEKLENAIGIPKSKLPIHGKEEEHQWDLLQRCHADCHDGASTIRQMRDITTGKVVLSLRDGKGIHHIHTAKHAAISFDEETPTKINYDADREKYIRYHTNETPILADIAIPTRKQVIAEQMQYPAPLSNDDELALLLHPPKKRPSIKLPFRKATAKNVNDVVPKSRPHVATVDHDVSLRK